MTPTKIFDITAAKPNFFAAAAFRQGCPMGAETCHDPQILQLTSRLQTTLDIALLIEIFAAELSADVTFDRLEYMDSSGAVVSKLGNGGLHSAAYALRIDDSLLGQLIFGRRTRFSEDELARLERYLSVLVYPLRNAILYKNAMQAAIIDPLTGVGNRAAFGRQMQYELAVVHRHGTALSLVMIDIDFFKSVNDQYGHVVGDQVLKSVAATIAGCIRKTDLVCRLGGEEFALLLNNTDLAGAILLVNRIRDRIRSHQYAADSDRDFNVTASFGVASTRPDDVMDSLLKRSDEALYRAKQSGRDCISAASVQ